MQPKSPGKRGLHVLGPISEKKACAFLLDSVNLPNPIDDPNELGSFERWLHRWQRWFTMSGSDDAVLTIPRARLQRFATELRTSLRRVWHERDERQRDWYIYRLRDEHHRMILREENPGLIDISDPLTIPRLQAAIQQLEALERASKLRRDDADQRHRFAQEWAAGTDLFSSLPTLGAFEGAAYWLQRNQKRLIYCPGLDCPAPYVFRTEKGQRFCSPECANVARSAAKLKWWNESPNSPKNKSTAATVRTKRN